MSDDEAERSQDFEDGLDDVLGFVLGGVDAGQDKIWLTHIETGNVPGRRRICFLGRG